MSAPLRLRDDLDAADLRRLALQVSDAVARRRILAIAAIYDGASRTQAAIIGQVERQVVRSWVHRFNLEGLEAFSDRAPAFSAKLTDEQMAEIRALLARRHLRTDELVAYVYERFGISISSRRLADSLRRIRRQGARAKDSDGAATIGSVQAFC